MTMNANFMTAAGSQVQVEQQVKAIITSNAVQPGLNHFYMDYGKKVAQLVRKHSGAVACTEANIAQQKWVTRGLDFNILETIKTLYITCAGAAPVQPFRLDVSLLDGPDVLV